MTNSSTCWTLLASYLEALFVLAARANRLTLLVCGNTVVFRAFRKVSPMDSSSLSQCRNEAGLPESVLTL